MGPPYLALFFIAMTKMEGKSWTAAFDKVKTEFWSTYKADMALWVPAAAVNFLWVPKQYRVLYVSFISVFWK